jgi:NAD(P)-dependent dehydrogenase (short-subunit alcohol dehydrogenase family)
MNKVKVALVTGASRGIGAATAIQLGAQGISVAVGYRKNFEQAQKVVSAIVELGGSAVSMQLDILNRQNIKEIILRINDTIGKVNILVNNAAIAQEKPFLNITDFEWDEMLKSNLSGPFTCIQEVLPEMIEMGWGRIVNIASVGGQWGGINQIHYASAKAGLIGLTRSIAKTFSIYGITCNAISPGLIKTDMSASELTTESGKEKIKQIPVGRLGIPEDIASSVSYLVSDEASYVTGQTINLNGGMYFG